MLLPVATSRQHAGFRTVARGAESGGRTSKRQADACPDVGDDGGVRDSIAHLSPQPFPRLRVEREEVEAREDDVLVVADDELLVRVPDLDDAQATTRTIAHLAQPSKGLLLITHGGVLPLRCGVALDAVADDDVEV